jgi:anthraniloyl-CoA monooxygenase
MNVIGTRRVAVIGGGPAGLFFARLMCLTQPGVIVEVHERNAADDATGFGVVFSDRTMAKVRAADPATHQRIAEASVPVTDMELRLPGETLRYGGFRFVSIGRRVLLNILREQAEQAGATLRFRSEVPAGGLADADVVVLANGANSAHRDARPNPFGTSVLAGTAPYIWLGTSAPFDGATFAFLRTELGSFAAHAYPYGDGMSTFVVETEPAALRASEMDLTPTGSRRQGDSDDHALRVLTELFADHLGGHKLVGHKSRWATFNVVHNQRWSHGNSVLLGDAAHTAHFTVGSGTKMAMEDAIALAGALRRNSDNAVAFAEYETGRRAPVSRVQRWAESSMRWWETFGRRLHLPAAQFGLHFMTRTSALSYLGMRRRFPDEVDRAEAVYFRGAGAGHAVGAPLRLGSVELPNRLVTVAPEQAALGTGLVALRGSAGAEVVFAELPCPPASEWSGEGDDLVERARALAERGVAGVLLAPDPSRESWWAAQLCLASRIRTEVGLPVAVCAPDGWALDLATDPATDSWPARIHLALVSGRADLIAGWPVPRPAPHDVSPTRGKDGAGHGHSH